MQNNQPDINVGLLSRCIALSNEVTHLRGCLADSIPLDEHMAVVDELSASETRAAVHQQENIRLREEIGRLRKDNEDKTRRIDESERKIEALNRQVNDLRQLQDMLQHEHCDAKSVIELLTRCIFGRSSEKSEFTAMLADALQTSMDIHDADRFLSQLADFSASAMASASPRELAKTETYSGKAADGTKPSRKRKDGSGGETTSRNEGNRRDHASRLRHGFHTVASHLDERFGISYGAYGRDISFTVKNRNGAPDQWTVRIAYMARPRVYCKEYTVANIYSRELGDDTSDRPAQIVEGCPFSPSFAAYYLTMKFAYNLPELKIIRMLREMGCTVKQSTLNKWMHRVMGRVREVLEPPLLREVQSARFMHNDETRILVRVWNADRQREEYRTCYIHGAYAPDCRLLAMVYEKGSRAAGVCGQAVFRDFRGVGFTADRCPIYDAVSRDGAGNLILVYGACWTHARRYCLQAYLSDSRLEGVMACINVLFSIERHCRVMGMTPQQRLEFRKRHSAPIVDSIMSFLRMVKESHEYGELAKRAANYMLNGETAFRAFLMNGYIELENNAIERLFRHLATGRRNWTHSGSHQAAANIAFMYSIYESCVMNDVSFTSYIETVLDRIMDGDTNYRDMLPNRIVLPSGRQDVA